MGVSPGAEVLARQYLCLWRAYAEWSGDKTARIVCQSLEAELLAWRGLSPQQHGAIDSPVTLI